MAPLPRPVYLNRIRARRVLTTCNRVDSLPKQLGERVLPAGREDALKPQAGRTKSGAG